MISPPPPLPPAYLIGDCMKSILPEKKKEKPSFRYRGVNIYPHCSRQKNTSLQVKGLYNRAGIDQVKRLKIMDQDKKVEMNYIYSHCPNPYLGLGTCSPREILNISAPNEANWGYSRPFQKLFFHLLKSKTFWRPCDI